MAEGNDSLYLYCVTSGDDGGHSFGPIGVGQSGGEVRTVASDGIGIVVSRSPRVPFGEVSPEQTLRHLAAHQRVIEQVMNQSTVVPLKFGTYADGEADVRKILDDNRNELKRALERFHGKIELDVVVTWPDMGPVFREIAREEPVEELKARIAALPPDQASQARIQLGRLVEERLDQRRTHLADEILAGLRDLAHDLSINDLKDESMIVNVALLLDRSAEQDLDARIHELDERFEGAMNFRCVGPLPPYSFGTAEVETIDAETLDAARSALGLPPAASFNEIKQAHRGLARELHPDNNPTHEAAARLQQVRPAFKLLEEYCHNVKHSFASGACQGLAMVAIRTLSELRAPAAPGS